MSNIQAKNYSLTGGSNARAVESGLAGAKWYRTHIPRAELKALTKRSDSPAIRDTLLWLGLIILFAAAAVALWPSLWSIPFLLAYGVLYGSGGDARWHECGHGTAFKTGWMNDVVYQIASFMMMRNPTMWRWSHTRHHTDTLVVGRDREILIMRPPNLPRLVLNLFGVPDAVHGMKSMVLNALGYVDPEERTFVPAAEWPKMFLVARIWLVIYVATILLAIYLGSILPLLLIGLPRLYGTWHSVLCAILQHSGLAEDVVDHRLNTRTVYMNPISRFIYLNMNYHVEHHMFPMIPYHALPRLHERIKQDLPAPCPGFLSGFREVLPVLLRQRHDKDYFLTRALPAGAAPYQSVVAGDAVDR